MTMQRLKLRVRSATGCRPSTRPAMFTATSTSLRRIKLVGVGSHELVKAARADARTDLGRFLVYWAPEVANGSSPTSRSDIYSLGIVVYTLVQGAPPFSANDDKELIRQHAKANLPPMDPRVPTLVQRMVADMLQKKPDNRTIDAEAIIKRIETTLDTTVTLLDPTTKNAD